MAAARCCGHALPLEKIFNGFAQLHAARARLTWPGGSDACPPTAASRTPFRGISIYRVSTLIREGDQSRFDIETAIIRTKLRLGELFRPSFISPSTTAFVLDVGELPRL